MDHATLRAQLPFTLARTDFPALGEKYQGKVRDTYAKGERLVLVTTDRLSAFDHVLTTLPFKGDLLNQLAQHWFKATAHIVPNHVLDVPDPCVTVARRAQPFAVELVVRAHLTGSLWRDYQAGKDPYGLKLPPGLTKNSAFPAPVFTPSTKAPKGQHDEPISAAQVVERGLLTARQLAEVTEAAFAIFREGQRLARARGLVLVDTKYEMGLVQGKLTLIDEIHTPDSSRYWELDSLDARLAKGEEPVMLDKENLRQWLITERNFSGHGPLPQIPDDVRVNLAGIYARAFERITGAAFEGSVGDVSARLAKNLASLLRG
ncbi:MAG: phosphoribosylaminoimidazolesuccinocarboxamide synthase [Myxococcaceae bacterium]|nr:phosphoribosylaminoimidazolesuccinocarboxamide synthase [Myxococcaceae bacterium]